MVLGLPIATFKLIYVIISLFAMFSGMMVVRDMRKMRPLGIWNPLFFFTTILLAVSGSRSIMLLPIESLALYGLSQGLDAWQIGGGFKGGSIAILTPVADPNYPSDDPTQEPMGEPSAKPYRRRDTPGP